MVIKVLKNSHISRCKIYRYEHSINIILSLLYCIYRVCMLASKIYIYIN